MRASWKAGMTAEESLVDLRARLIRDPAARLRYLRGAMAVDPPAPRARRDSRSYRLAGVLLAAVLLVPARTSSDIKALLVFERPVAVAPAASDATGVPAVWQVERKETFETYSNGLRIETGSAVSNQTRRYLAFALPELRRTEWRQAPVGIVYHTTESHQAPFDPDHNGRLQRVAGWLLEYVQRSRSYHYVIDRFGRVHRVVQETDSANHAGFSVWADGQWAYLNLNSSFLGVALETQTERSETPTGVSAAQIHAAKVLTQMLRSRYGILASNCVTHAQVSVNPRSFRIGNHTDWAGNFPFPELGLPDNYSLPAPSMHIFGFGYDAVFVESTGMRLWKGLLHAEDLLRQQAASQGVPVARYRAALRDRYRDKLAALEAAAAAQESQP